MVYSLPLTSNACVLDTTQILHKGHGVDQRAEPQLHKRRRLQDDLVLLAALDEWINNMEKFEALAEFEAEATTGNFYWEGPVEVAGGGGGVGFVELTDYAPMQFPELEASSAGGGAE